MDSDNRVTFAVNVVAILEKYVFRRIDFDSKYPGELDIKGILPGSLKDGQNYFLFLADL